MRHHELLFDLADCLTEPPSGGRVQMWVAGVLISIAILGYGICCCVTGHATTLNITMRGFQPLGRGLLLDVHGTHAVSLGLVCVFAGLFTQFQWFWGNHERLADYHEIGKNERQKHGGQQDFSQVPVDHNLSALHLLPTNPCIQYQSTSRTGIMRTSSTIGNRKPTTQRARR